MKLSLQVAIGILLILGNQASGQDLSGHFYTEKQKNIAGEHVFVINLPVGIKSEQVQIVYFLTGTFGGYGMPVKPESGKDQYRITTTVDGKAADTLKALVFAPGCQIVKISISSLISTTKASFACETTTSLPFTGQIEQLGALRGHDYEVEIRLVGRWGLDFFGIGDGIEPTFHIASLTPDNNGSFRGQLPDLNQDVLINSVGSNKAAFSFAVREKSTQNTLGMLQPTDKKYDLFGDLRLQPAYPDDIIFRVR
jgi:hypothetical protein